MPRISRKGKEKATSVFIKGKQAIREEAKRKNIDKGLPEDDSTTSDGEKINMEGDLPGKRLNALKSVLRRLLLYKKRTHSLTEDNFERDEVYQRAGAKNLLKISGYSGKTRPIFPTISVSTLQSLRLDSAMIFNIFCSGTDNKLNIYDYNREEIPTQQAAVSMKDALFNAFFDLKKITEVCMENGLKFAHNVYILPGAKTVRILSNLQKTTSAERCTINSRAKNKNEGEQEASARVQIEEKNHKAILQDEINLLTTEISALESQLKKAYKDKNNQRFHIELKAQKQKWLWPNEDLQEKLSFARQSKHFKLMARNTRHLPQIKKDTQTGHDDGKKKITDDIPNLLDKVENIKLQSALEDFIFSGTDNGIKTMTETVALSLQRYNYHLDLYRLYNSDNSSGKRKEYEFQALSRSMKIYSKDVDIGTGEAYMRC
ncbi:MAG: hypothetical protein EXX96DRAFT_649552 [Benjaminiella poitrasii]|nr:MAG: hypothetical protein EXX96DRAFT_649552 [Benjaminiella poitrasii]